MQTRTLNPENQEDMIMIDEFNKKLYETYQSSGGKLKQNKLDELVLDPTTGRVYVKDLSVYDEEGNKITKVKYTYAISSRKIANGEYKSYIVRHKNKYVYAKRPTNKFEYLLKIADGKTDVKDKFVIPNLKQNNNITQELYDYLNNSDIDVDNKIKLQKCIKEVLTKPDNEERHKDFYSKCVDVSNALSRNRFIPPQYKFNFTQIVNWVYRTLH